MATVKELVTANLQALVSQVGSADKVIKLPVDTIIAAIAHTDDVLAITTDNWVIDITDMLLSAGYEVYDKDYNLLYNMNPGLGLTSAVWGSTDYDIYLVWYLKPGETVYLTYQSRVTGQVRTLLLIRF